MGDGILEGAKLLGVLKRAENLSSREGNRFVTEEYLSTNTSFDSDELDETLNSLRELGLVERKNYCARLTPSFDLLYECMRNR